MSDHEVALEFLVDWAVTVTDSCLKILNELLEHLTENLELDVAI